MMKNSSAVNYSTLTNAQLNREVARRQGWRPTGDFDWEYLTPDGRRVDINDTRWASDLNAAAALDFGNAILVITIRAARTEVEVLLSDGSTLLIDDTSESRARTIAGLMYQDAIAAV